MSVGDSVFVSERKLRSIVFAYSEERVQLCSDFTAMFFAV